MVSGWCPCVPLGRRQSPAQQQQQQQPPSSSRAPFTVSGATDRADMVQMFYYENRGKCCKKLLRYNGYPNKVRRHALAISFRGFVYESRRSFPLGIQCLLREPNCFVVFERLHSIPYEI
ncbi:hypothetical protein HN011_004637 [Eciton burchellii]|nr:hypothetical protein HN011_004637 [Eciton burchellii]